MAHEQLLKQLIDIKSYSRQEGELRNFMAEWFKKKGIEAFAQGENLLVHFEGADSSRAFVFNSHMDTVSAGEERLWKYGPWNPTSETNKIVGLGASDMKSGVAASMLLAEQIATAGTPLVDMWFTYVVMEEVDGSGTASFCQWFEAEGFLKKYRDKTAIVTEPTALKHIEIGHKGNLFIVAETSGDSGHGSQPGKVKKHAVYEMFAFAQGLEDQMKIWSQAYPHDVFKTGQTVGSMTSIAAGLEPDIRKGKYVGWKPQSVNKFPAICTATFDIRTGPGFHEVAWENISGFANSRGVKVNLVAEPTPYGYTHPSKKIVRVSQSILSEVELVVADWATDMGILIGRGIDGIILGPGEPTQAHKTNEYCYPKQITQAVEVYQSIVEAWTVES